MRAGLGVYTITLVSALAWGCGSEPVAPVLPTLKLMSITPTQGSVTGQTVVTVTGTEFGTDATLTIGGVAATAVKVESPTTLTGAVARSEAGLTDVVVTSGGKTATLPNAFAFVAPTGSNLAPVVAGIRSIGTRPRQPSGFGDLAEPVMLVATVNDSETALSALTYEWSGPGAFDGSGSTVTWRIPSTLTTVPDTVTVELIVTEVFGEGAVNHRNVGRGAFAMRVHDSSKEILGMGEDFLTLFSRSEVSSNDVLHNFSTTCDGGAGRANEKSDVDNNRATYIQDFSKFRIAARPPVLFNFGSFCGFRFRPGDACASYSVHWEVTDRRNGARGSVDGIDHVTAVLENNTWRLCHSDFEGTSTNLRTGEVRPLRW